MVRPHAQMLTGRALNTRALRGGTREAWAGSGPRALLALEMAEISQS